MPQPRKQYDKKQVLIPLYNAENGISTGEFADILDCNRNTARRILVELKQEGLVTETGIQTVSYNASAKQNIKHNQAGLKNNLNPWKITEAGKEYVEKTVIDPLIADEDVRVWIFAVVYGEACKLNATKCDLLTKLGIQIKSESDFELTDFGVEIYYDFIRDDVVSFEGFDNILTPLAKAESVTTKKLKQICQNDYKLRVLKTLEFIEEIKKGHWALTEDALEDMEVFLHNTEAYEEDNDRHECYLLVRDRLAALKLSEPVDNEDEEPLYSEVTLEIMSYLSGSCSYTVAELVKFIGFSSKIIEAELLDMDSKNAAFQQDNVEWCLTAEAEDYWDEILREKLIDKLTDADFDWLVDLYKNRETTSGCEHTKEMELLGWITKNESGGWKITPDGCEHAIIELELDLENVDEIKEQEEPLLITEQLLTFDEIDEKPVLRFAIPIRNETVNGWIEIETINDEHYKDVILAIHADTTAALDLTEFFDSAILDGISKYPDGTRRFECNRKVAYAFFKMIMEKPVLQCGIDTDEG